MIIHSVWRREKARLSAASHCATGIDWSAAAHDLGDVGHDRQGEPHHRLDPGRHRNT